MYFKGIIKKDNKTKNMIRRLNPSDIALINHRDLDEMAALSLAEKKVGCVVNVDETISGKYPNRGPSVLLDANIPIFEADEEIFDIINEGEEVEIDDNSIIRNGEKIGECQLLDKEKIKELLDIGKNNLEIELDEFIENTLNYAKKEKGLVTEKITVPKTKVNLKNKHALVVVRGKDYKADLEAIKPYINEVKPVLIGVDGGADALLESGYKPNIVIGDMDSVSDKCLKQAMEIIVHAYPDGRSPGLERVEGLGLNATVFPSPGTSEDVALLLAYSNGADLIVAVGTHSNMIDFLEKGRKGMSSTFLVRLKVGPKLVDAKGVNKLYNSPFKLKYVLGILIAALIPIVIITLRHPLTKDLITLLKIRLSLYFGL